MFRKISSTFSYWHKKWSPRIYNSILQSMNGKKENPCNIYYPHHLIYRLILLSFHPIYCLHLYQKYTRISARIYNFEQRYHKAFQPLSFLFDQLTKELIIIAGFLVKSLIFIILIDIYLHFLFNLTIYDILHLWSFVIRVLLPYSFVMRIN